jgi:hypothetical protein
MNFDGENFGPEGCIFDTVLAAFPGNAGLNEHMNDLRARIVQEFPDVGFTMGDVVSMAGKVSIEMAFPCVRPAWRSGRRICNAEGITNSGPPGSLDTSAKLQPFLNRYGLNAREMAVLTIGAHSIKNAEFVPWVFNGENSGPKFINATVNTAWIVNDELRPEELGHSYLTVLPNDQVGARLSSDMMFFPKALGGLGDASVTVDNTFDGLEDNLKALSENAFDAEFEAVFSKMLEIGTQGLGAQIANRPKGGECAV